MRCSWLYAVLVGGVVLLSLSACRDTTDVGLGVGPTPSEGRPVTLNITPKLDTTARAPQTGRRLASLLGETPQWRFLVGRVDDPLPGTGILEAHGYFDVSTPTSLPGRIANETDPDSISAQLRFTTTYVHGDTASAVNVEVQMLTEEADMNRARADTSFPAGAFATEGPVPVSPTDSLVTIDLPDSWLTTERLNTLQDTSQEFHGFKLTSGAGEDAVVGFSATTATLRLIHEADSTTVDYRSIKTFTHVEQTGTPAPSPDSYVLLQDGVGTGLKMNWNFDAHPLDTLNSDPLNSAQIFVPVDTTALKNRSGPSTFVRPLPKGFRIIAQRASAPNAPSCADIQVPVLTKASEKCVLPLVSGAAPGAALVSNTVAFPIFEQSLRRTRKNKSPVFSSFRVYVADRPGTSGSSQITVQPGLPSTLPVLVPTGGDTPGPPRATLTVTPL